MTCLADKTNHPVRRPFTLPVCTTNMHHQYAPPICTTNHQIFPFKLDRPDFNVADTLYSRFLLALVVLQCRLGNISQRHRPIEQKSTCRLLFKKFHPECRCIFADHYSCYAPPLLLLYTIKSNCRLFVFLPSTLVQTPNIVGHHIFSLLSRFM